MRAGLGFGVRHLGDPPPAPSCPPPPPAPPADTDLSLELQELREERNRLDAELQLSARLIQQEVGRAREQGRPGEARAGQVGEGPSEHPASARGGGAAAAGPGGPAAGAGAAARPGGPGQRGAAAGGGSPGPAGERGGGRQPAAGAEPAAGGLCRRCRCGAGGGRRPLEGEAPPPDVSVPSPQRCRRRWPRWRLGCGSSSPTQRGG